GCTGPISTSCHSGATSTRASAKWTPGSSTPSCWPGQASCASAWRGGRRRSSRRTCRSLPWDRGPSASSAAPTTPRPAPSWHVSTTPTPPPASQPSAGCSSPWEATARPPWEPTPSASATPCACAPSWRSPMGGTCAAPTAPPPGLPPRPRLTPSGYRWVSPLNRPFLGVHGARRHTMVAMGLEAECTVRVGRRTSAGRALLETEALIFRGEFSLQIPFGSMRDVSVDGDALVVKTDDQEARFEMGAAVADRWLRLIKEPKSLFEKLEVRQDMRVAVVDI